MSTAEACEYEVQGHQIQQTSTHKAMSSTLDGSAECNITRSMVVSWRCLRLSSHMIPAQPRNRQVINAVQCIMLGLQVSPASTAVHRSI